jgi:hypothetical protein
VVHTHLSLPEYGLYDGWRLQGLRNSCAARSKVGKSKAAGFNGTSILETKMNDITTETPVHLIDRRPGEQIGLASDQNPHFIHFGTLKVQPIKIRVLTSDRAETPEDFALADRVFEHVRARLIQFTNEIESELGESWKIMVRDADASD